MLFVSICGGTEQGFPKGTTRPSAVKPLGDGFATSSELEATIRDAYRKAAEDPAAAIHHQRQVRFRPTLLNPPKANVNSPLENRLVYFRSLGLSGNWFKHPERQDPLRTIGAPGQIPPSLKAR